MLNNRVGDVSKGFEEKTRSSDVAGSEGQKINKKGFLLTIGDPFGREVLRLYAKAKKISKGLNLPFVMPHDDPATKDALENYVPRANDGCDTERAFDARVALRRCK